MDKNLSINPQLLFLKQIEDLIPDNSSLVHELSDLLDISTDSAYRRLRGETSLSFDEIIILCNQFNISFDSFTEMKSPTNTVTYRYMKIGDTIESFKKYLDLLLSDLEVLFDAKEGKIFYAAEDIPMFYHFKYPELTAFKIFYWLKSVLNVKEYVNEKFTKSIVDEEILELCSKMNELYCSIPSCEIWTELTVNSIIKQIEFYLESGLFANPDEANDVCNQLLEEFAHIQKQAEFSQKFLDEDIIDLSKNNFTLYNSDVEIGNNCILVKMGDYKSVYLTHLTFNMINTSNQDFCEETEKWFNNLMRKSNPISGVSEKLRYQFFATSIKKIEKLKEKIM